MKISISTNIFKAEECYKIFDLIDSFEFEVGIELFPEWQDIEFQKFLNEYIDKLKEYRVSLHGPYYETEHSAGKGSIEYERSDQFFLKSLELSKELNSSYIVYHHNNCIINDDNKIEKIKNSREYLIYLNSLADKFGTNIYIENAGVDFKQNVIFNEDEFIEECLNTDNYVLIDLGHAFANGWDIYRLIDRLKGKIKAYHLHNNDGKKDMHDSILTGSYDIDDFLYFYNKVTPEAELVLEYSKNYANKFDIFKRDAEYIREYISNL